MRPNIAIFLLPYLSLNLPHEALVNAHANAEIAKIKDVWNSDRPRSRASGGTITKTNDWPKPTENKPILIHNYPERVIIIYLKYL
mgnify:CR=1 FL=1